MTKKMLRRKISQETDADNKPFGQAGYDIL
jgi:hypothetical protein